MYESGKEKIVRVKENCAKDFLVDVASQVVKEFLFANRIPELLDGISNAIYLKVSIYGSTILYSDLKRNPDVSV